MDKFRQAAIEEAKLGLAGGGRPIGSMLVLDGENADMGSSPYANN